MLSEDKPPSIKGESMYVLKTKLIEKADNYDDQLLEWHKWKIYFECKKCGEVSSEELDGSKKEVEDCIESDPVCKKCEGPFYRSVLMIGGLNAGLPN